MTKQKSKPVTAGELMAQLEADPEFVARRAAAEAERQARVAQWRLAETPLREDLEAVGISIKSIWDLVNRAEPYPEAIPILVEHLQRPYPESVLEGIARSLAVPDARGHWDLFVRLYRAAPGGRVKHGLALAVAAAVQPAVLDTYFELLQDVELGDSRILLLGAISRKRDARTLDVLAKLQDDPDMGAEVRRKLALRKRKMH